MSTHSDHHPSDADFDILWESAAVGVMLLSVTGIALWLGFS